MLSVYIGGMGLLFYCLALVSNLRLTIDGTLTWTFSEEGVRIKGFIVTEVPWSEVQCWYEAADHLILGITMHTRGRSRRGLQGAGAPLEAFTPEQLAQTRALLTKHVGPDT